MILVTDKVNFNNSGVIEYGISDHFLIYCTRKVQRKVFSGHRTIMARSLKNYSVDNLKSQLEQANWSQVFMTSEVDEAWGTFKSLFLKAIDSVAPLRQIRVKQGSEPWFDSSIRDSINQRDSALAKFKRSEDKTDFDNFKILRNQTKEKIRTAKKNYFADTIKENKKDTSKLWKILKQLGCGGGDANHRSTEPNVGLSTEGGIEFDSNKVATIFNNFFTSIASKLVSSLPPKLDQYGEDFVSTFYRERGVVNNSFSLNKVTVFKVTNILSELNIKKGHRHR